MPASRMPSYPTRTAIMKRLLSGSLRVLVFGLLAAGALPAPAQHLARFVAGSGAIEAASGGLHLRATLGQTATGLTASGDRRLHAGFWAFASSDVGTGLTPEPESGLPRTFRLLQNYPNPFNPTTTIAFDLPATARVTLRVYDVLGREVARLMQAERLAPGRYRVPFEAAGLPSGVYLYHLDAVAAHRRFTASRRLVLLK